MGGPPGYSTPEEAALSTFGRYTRVLASEQNSSHAVVLLGTNEPPYLYPYQIVCSRKGDFWVEGNGGNGDGWSHLDNDLGVRTFWGEASEQKTVRLHYAGATYHAPVRHGYFFLAIWNVPYEFAD